MGGLSELVWSLRAKSIEVHSFNDESKDGEWLINVFISESDIQGWEELIRRLNAVFNRPYKFIRQETKSTGSELCTIVFNTAYNSNKLEKEAEILTQAVIKEEFKVYPIYSKKLFDIKLGISCNNNCIHCVIKPNVFNIKNQYPESVVLDSGIGMQCSRDLKFSEAVDILEGVSDVGTIVLTGGEPTIRKDFIDIVKWIYYNKPYAAVALQTNGRNLSNKDLVRALRRYTRNPTFAVAIHGLEETHNLIVNNRKELGNPFKETIQGIKNLNEVFRIDRKIRTEIVLSNLNIEEIPNAVKFQYEELGIRIVGVSYPHLAGFAEEDVKKLAPNLSEVCKLLNSLNKHAAACGDLDIFIEEVPFCIFNQLEGEIVLKSFENRNKSNAVLNFMGNQNNNFHNCWLSEHVKFDACKGCAVENECVGIWQESKEINEKHIKPILDISSDMSRFLKINWEC